MELKKSFHLSLLVALIACPVINASASAADVGPCNFSGITLGMGLGLTTFMSDTKNDTILLNEIDAGPAFFAPPVLGNSHENYARNNLFSFGPVGNIFLGYGKALSNHGYIGTELGLNFLEARQTFLKNTSSDNVSTFDASASTNGVYSSSLSTETKVRRDFFEPFLDLKFGMLMSPTTLVYLRGGINYNSFTVKSNAYFQATDSILEEDTGNVTTSATTSTAFSSSAHKNAIGVRAGMGTEVMITPEFGIGAEYIYSFYPTVHSSSSAIGSDVICDTSTAFCGPIPATFTSTGEADLNDQQVTAQMIYHFG